MLSRPPPRSPAAAASADLELFSDDYITVRIEPDGLLVWLVRSSIAHPDISTLMWSFEGVIAALDRAGRSGRSMLFDTRAACGRNDPEFERAMTELRPRVERQFFRVGVLVASAVGALQIRRWKNADGVERLTGTNAEDLAKLLRADLGPRKG